ncbi:MAG: hypothetical protein OXC63_03910 [Aestuariivita sp.]|nr:hypothetical protein [Aestuariivita sp.]MCY4347007.1 hypothetical protein [Aestuariivita sp.]
MVDVLYLPTDSFSDGRGDLDLAADYLELTAFFSPENMALSQSVTEAIEEAAEEDYRSVEKELNEREETVAGAIARISKRIVILGEAYPFKLDKTGDVVSFLGSNSLSFSQAAYLVSLVLSHLRSVSPVLSETSVYPTKEEIKALRKYFQYFATAGLAAEIGGPAWSFGFPRPDGANFIDKLSEIWRKLQDGRVSPNPSAPRLPKDDQVDVFAWRQQRDGLPGFLLAAAQVATGKNWKDKSIRCQVSGVFASRWFNPQPVTTMVAYHIIPFTRPDNKFRDDVLVLGNILHRLRLPYRVMEAEYLVQRGVVIETYEKLAQVVTWLQDYKHRVGV